MIEQLEQQLNDFSLEERFSALKELLKLARQHPNMLPAQSNSLNMHCHSFFSFNSYGYSPTALVWLAKKLGLQAAGIVDFDTLEGVEEFLIACDMANLRGSAAMESRIYIAELSNFETNSPGEPGISYACGIGFSSGLVNHESQIILNGMKQRADQRNRSLIERLNAFLHPITIDYDHHVLPLTPSGNATERHILIAYLQAVNSAFKKPSSFWSVKLDMPHEKVYDLMQKTALFSDIVRRKLMKLGGVGYIKPSPQSFPTTEEFYRMVKSNHALPTYNYLDGSTNGEERMEDILDLLVKKGVSGFNLIPNLAIPEMDAQLDNTKKRDKQIQLLFQNVKIAQAFDLPLHIGTEMNSHGQRKMDNLDSPELIKLQQVFMDGAYFIYGHVSLQRILGIGYQSEWAASWLPIRAEKNSFFTKVGYSIPPGAAGIEKMKNLDISMNPSEILKKLEEY